jgi:hypothetical protein
VGQDVFCVAIGFLPEALRIVGEPLARVLQVVDDPHLNPGRLGEDDRHRVADTEIPRGGNPKRRIHGTFRIRPARSASSSSFEKYAPGVADTKEHPNSWLASARGIPAAISSSICARLMMGPPSSPDPSRLVSSVVLNVVNQSARCRACS